MTPKEQFIAWLNDARSTELAMIPVLKNHANDARDYPEVYERNMRHLEETQHQAERLEDLITNLGGSVSTVKTVIGKVFGAGQSISTEFFPDEMIKNFLADYAAEQFEIASYTSLIATARIIGEDECVPTLEGILREEIAMADWIREHIPMATSESLKKTTEPSYGEDYSDSDRRSRGGRRGLTRSRSRSRMSPGLKTILSIGAIGTGAALLFRSQQNKNRKSELSSGEKRVALDASRHVVPTSEIATDESGAQTAAVISMSDTPTNS
jgi:ferritin-like metal-binding protein YciE